MGEVIVAVKSLAASWTSENMLSAGRSQNANPHFSNRTFDSPNSVPGAKTGLLLRKERC
jgi:hypothetical protein